jgi:hypothetical protein
VAAVSDLPGRLVIAGLTCLAVGGLCFIAFLITATREVIHNHRRRNEPMPHPPTLRESIAAALDDWWITTDPVAPFHAPAVADLVDSYLTGLGYTIHTDTPRNPVPARPGRREITFSVLSGLTAAATIQAAYNGHWWWITSAVLAVVAVVFFVTAVRADTRDEQRP